MNPEEKRAYMAKWRIDNANKIKAYNKQRREKGISWEQQNPEKSKQTKAKWLKNNSQKRKESTARYRNKKREKARAYNRVYIAKRRKENPDAEKAREKAWRKTNLPYKIRKALRGRIQCAIHRSLGYEGKRAGHTMDLIGCSAEDLIKHLEKQFQPGMSWDNWSLRGWHIDHIRPCASFDLSDPEQQKQCFHWTNLQPLWAEDNQRKNARWEEPSGNCVQPHGIENHVAIDNNLAADLQVEHDGHHDILENRA